jgi:RimJ/RimL family protein N-acetyltransferase
VSVAIRRLTRQDAGLYRDIRLESLRLHPHAYAATHDNALTLPDEHWAASPENMLLVGAFADTGDMVGLAGYFRSNGAKDRHRGWLVQMYVREAARGSGCAMALVEAIVAHARTEVLQLHLGVWDENPAAIRFYEKAGFHIYASDPRAYFWDGRFYGDHSMVRYFDEAPGRTTDD